MDTQFSLNKLHATIQISYQISEALFPSRLQAIVDASSSQFHGDTLGDTVWPEGLSDNYTAVSFWK